MKNPSPLRYPGGKARLAPILGAVIKANGLLGATYVEPFAGGAGAGIRLLIDGLVDRVLINDADPAIHAFWSCVQSCPEKLIDRVMTTDISIPEWKKQRDVYRKAQRASRIGLAFATFYLNRCNRSGIIAGAGPIGGLRQEGKWKLSARFNREDLAERIEELASFGDRVIVSGLDASKLISDLPKIVGGDRVFIYADPPYFNKGRELYLSSFGAAEHKAFASVLKGQRRHHWVATYDNVEYIREIYSWAKVTEFGLRYSAHASSPRGQEVFIAPEHVHMPPAVEGALENGELRPAMD